MWVGPFNSWDRQPYLTTVRTGEPSMIMQWREIHHNFFIDNYSPQEDVDNDDGSCFYHTHDNFFARRDSAEDFCRLGALLFTAMAWIFIPAYCFAAIP